ncbi:exonuclease domain-containing protein [Streptomyces shenzhenensis]|uniref:exonuclease domain-containing protein n=1 Tax=Streptomyces shenzhenensis TaxID=943815 RepID=UPI00368C938D
MNAFADVWRTAWDTETTGTDPVNDRIVTAAFIVRAPGMDDRPFTWLINPGVPIPPETTEVHGIDDAKAQAEGQDPKTALDAIAGHLVAAITRNMPVVAFNQSFDWSILHYELIRNGLPTMYDRLGREPVTLVDPLVLDKKFGERPTGKGQRRLQPTAERYGVKLDDWHEAKADALAALLIAEEQFERFPQLARMTPEQLFGAQQQWRAKQAAGTQWWFREKATPEEGGDPNKVIDGSWPLIPAPRDGGES